MPLEQLANIAEIFGMFVILITLIFLTIQMRQNTAAMRSAATREAHQQLAQYYEMHARNDAVRDTMIKGLSDPVALSETETSRFFSIMMIAAVNFQNWIIQTQSGAMEGEILSDRSAGLAGLLGRTKVRFLARSAELYRGVNTSGTRPTLSTTRRVLGSIG